MVSHADRILYVEPGGGLARAGGWIGRVRVSKTGKTLYYGSLQLQSLKGSGYKTNYFDVGSGERYWVSAPRRDGNDPLYPGQVDVDANVRAEYWLSIRGRPDCIAIAAFRTPGKYSKRRPHPECGRRQLASRP